MLYVIKKRFPIGKVGAMAEWSKAVDSRSTIFGCAGSNPAGANN